MNILQNITVPTGNILIVNGQSGKLECLSLGDYGQDVNIKADFLGLTRDLGQVKHTRLLPLRNKWVCTLSTQYGCSMGCKFCDVPKVGPGVNASYDDLMGQLMSCLSLHPEISRTDRLNIHFARMGEPTFNPNVIAFTTTLLQRREFLPDSLIHPVVSTMLPKKNVFLKDYLESWMDIKNVLCGGNAGLQFSINSTSDKEREEMFSGNSLSLDDISAIGSSLQFPIGRKITLNFAVAGYEVEAEKLRDLFDPKKFIVKLTPMHKTSSAVEHNIKTDGDYTTLYPYIQIEESLKKVGFDVLVFVASDYEDMSRITCGNAILSGSTVAIS